MASSHDARDQSQGLFAGTIPIVCVDLKHRQFILKTSCATWILNYDRVTFWTWQTLAYAIVSQSINVDLSIPGSQNYRRGERTMPHSTEEWVTAFFRRPEVSSYPCPTNLVKKTRLVPLTNSGLIWNHVVSRQSVHWPVKFWIECNFERWNFALCSGKYQCYCTCCKKLFTFCDVFSVISVDYSKTDFFEFLFKTIACNKFLQTKSVYVFTSVAILLPLLRTV